MLQNLKNTSKQYAIVAGNGPSLADIDYTRLPPPPPHSCDSLEQQSYDVFRCNQFYFEDKYYLGREVCFAFANPSVLFEQSYTYQTLTYKKEYNIQNIVVSEFHLNHLNTPYRLNKRLFSDIICGGDVLYLLADFFAFVRHNGLHYYKNITSGIYMCAFATALGYKKIYLAGIDLYLTKPYAFDTMRPNLLTLNPDFTQTPSSIHSPETDIEALMFLANTYGVEFYTISPKSPLANHIPLADSINNNTFIVEEKQDNSINDMLIPSKTAYDKLHYEMQQANSL